MELIIRPIHHSTNPVNSVRIIQPESPVLEADAVSVTANPDPSSPMGVTCNLYRWKRDLVHRAAVRVNRAKKVGALVSQTPKIFLIPKTLGKEPVEQLMQELMDAIDEEGVEVLHFSHYRTIKYGFPIQEITSVLAAISRRQSKSSLRVLIWDIDSQFREEMAVLKRLWIDAA